MTFVVIFLTLCVVALSVAVWFIFHIIEILGKRITIISNMVHTVIARNLIDGNYCDAEE